MRNRLRYEEWENSLILYRMKEKEGNTAQCKKIIDNLHEKFGKPPTQQITGESKPNQAKVEPKKSEETKMPSKKQEPRASAWTKGKLIP